MVNKSYFLVLFVLVFSCEEAEFAEKNYPLVQMGEIEYLDDRGVIFNAEILNKGSQPIEEVGFAYKKETTANNQGVKEPSLEDNTVSTTLEMDQNNFSIEVTRDLCTFCNYYIRPFVKTKSVLVFGKTFEFFSYGGLAPEIFDFQPKSGPRNSPVLISGANFDKDITDNIVYFGNEIARMDSVNPSGTKLFVRVPFGLQPGEVSLRVRSSGKAITATETFTVE